MKQSSTQEKLKTLLETSHKRYLEYNEAYEESGNMREELTKKLMPILETSDADDPKFKELAKEYIQLYSLYGRDVSYVATKFLMVADTYRSVVGELEGEVEKDYKKIKALEHKILFSIKDKKFTRNSNEKLPEMPKEEYEELFRIISSQFKED